MIHAAAIRSGNTIWTLPAPNHHHDIAWLVKVEHKDLHSVECGFLDDQGNYLTPPEASLHAVQCGQISHCPPNLPSEHLW